MGLYKTQNKCINTINKVFHPHVGAAVPLTYACQQNGPRPRPSVPSPRGAAVNAFGANAGDSGLGTDAEEQGR